MIKKTYMEKINYTIFKKKKKFFFRRVYHILKIIKNYENFECFSSKKYYFNLLKKEICKFYNYTMDLTEQFFKLIPIDELIEFFEFNEKPRPLTVRFNTIKADEEKIRNILEKKGIKIFLENKIPNFGVIIKGKKINIGGTLEFLGGYYTLQGLSSFFPVLSLNPEKGEKILDLAAAPGGKAAFISQLMNNSGILVANDKNKIRVKSLVSSIHRLGIENSIITNFDGSIFPHKLGGFDKVLIDAPCTGTGIISHDNRIKTRKINSAILLTTTLQKRLLLAAIDSCKSNSKKGNIIIYSTCSILVEENESIIQYAIEKRKLEIFPTGLNFGLPGFEKYQNKFFDKKMKNCRRFYPHIHNIDGFFICKLKKK